MIDNSELEQMINDLQATMPDVCNVLSATRVSDGYGGWTDTWGTVVTNMPCRVDNKSGKLTATGGALETFSGVMITLPGTASVTTDNRIVTGGAIYNVLDADSGKSWQATLRVTAELAL